MTLRHEYFHALQFGFNKFYSNRSSSERGVVEGTAVAAERSLGTMVRSPNRDLRALDVGLFRGASSADTQDYRAQDFFIFLGLWVNKGIDHFIPFLRRGGLVKDLDDFLREEYADPTNLSQAYWAWVRNQSFEKTLDIGHGFFREASQCSLRHGSSLVYPSLENTTDKVEITATQNATVTDIILTEDGSYRVETNAGTYEIPYPLTPASNVFIGATLSQGDALAPFAHVPTRLLHRRLAEDATVSASTSLTSLTSRVVEFSLGPYDGNRSVRIDVDADPTSVASVFYDADEAGTTDCHGRSQARDTTVVLPPGRTKTIWVLVANTATSGPGRPIEVTARFMDANIPTIEILRPTANQNFPEGHPIPVSARVNVPDGGAQIRWYIGPRLVHEASITSSTTLYNDTIPVACPRGAQWELRAEIEDSQGLIAEDVVMIDVDSVTASERISIKARIGDATTVTRHSPMVHVPMALVGSQEVPDVHLSALFDPRTCGHITEANPARYTWRTGPTTLGQGEELQLTDADFMQADGIRQPLVITLSHADIYGYSQINLIPCTPVNIAPGEPLPALLGRYPACPNPYLLDSLFDDLLSRTHDLYREQDELNRALYFDALLDTIFDGRVPGHFAMGASDMIERMIPRPVAYHLFDLSRLMLTREIAFDLPLAIAENDRKAADGLDGEDLLLYLHASDLTRAHYSFFAHSELGGFDPWWMFTDDPLRRPVSDIDVLASVSAGLDAFLTGFGFENPNFELNETNLARGDAAATVGALQRATTKVGF